jgi:hypothetical protein
MGDWKSLFQYQKITLQSHVNQSSTLSQLERIYRRNGAPLPFGDVDVEYYLSLVEWTGRTIRADKPGSIPIDLECVLDRFGIDARQWPANVRSYSSLFYRITGKVEQFLATRSDAGRSGPAGSLAVHVCIER